MPKFVHHDALDAAFGWIADRGTVLAICAGAPASYAQATTTPATGGRQLGSISLTAGLGNGDYSVTAGTSNGRQLVVAAQTNIAITASGTADHLALLDPTGSRVLLVTSFATPRAVVAGDTVNIGSFADHIADPV